MGQKTWTKQHKGHEIKVTNYGSVLRWSSWESIQVDGVEIARNQGGMLRPSSYFNETLSLNGEETKLEVLIGSHGFSSACQIYLDGELAGGDVQARLNFPMPEEWREMRSKGLMRFLFFKGLIPMGIPFGLIMTVINRNREMTLLDYVWSFLFAAMFFGLSMGYYFWWAINKQYEGLD